MRELALGCKFNIFIFQLLLYFSFFGLLYPYRKVGNPMSFKLNTKGEKYYA